MEKEKSNQEVKVVPAVDIKNPPKNPLAPEVLAAIQQAVSASVAEVVKALKPIQAEVQKPDNIGTPNVPAKVPYVSKLKGIEVEPGQDLRHVHPGRIREWFTAQEVKWKANYNQRQIDGKSVNLNWTRG